MELIFRAKAKSRTVEMLLSIQDSLIIIRLGDVPGNSPVKMMIRLSTHSGARIQIRFSYVKRGRCISATALHIHA